MALPDEVKKRLAEHAAKNKGRVNLMGLDRTLGGVALDWAQENEERAAKWVARADGSLEYRVANNFEETRALSGLKVRYDEPAKVENRYCLRCPWVRIAYAPDWLLAEFANRWPSRRIAYPAFDRWASGPAFPVGPVAEFLRFLWPDAAILAANAKKYLTLVSENYTRRRPGVGARLRMAADHPYHPSGEATVTHVGPNGDSLGVRYAEVSASQYQTSTMVRNPDRWTVIG